MVECVYRDAKLSLEFGEAESRVMKTAIYIEDGVVQLVITPESKFEKNALSTFQDKPMEAKMFAGSFYDCRGGWVRQQAYYQSDLYGDSRHDQSLIIVTRELEGTPNTDALRGEEFDILSVAK